MADVIAIVVLADVLATYICYMCNRWKVTVVGFTTTCVEWVADVITIVTDGIATWSGTFLLWQMLLPLWQMDWPHGVSYFKFWDVKQSLVPYVRQMLFAYILFRDGLLTLMYIASFISVMRFWSSLPTILKFSNVAVWSVVLKCSYIGEGGSRSSLNLSKCSWGFSYIFFIIFHPVTFESVDDAILLGCRIFCLWVLPGRLKWFCSLWSTLAYHAFCRKFLCFHAGLLFMVPLHNLFCWWGWNCCFFISWYFCCFLLDGLEH